ncbi:thermonuclease family protein [Candidatus Parcubacteria bacterium]|nr:thermonuclease family protein [Candidatus Parcubacteria bacterium]
MKDKIKTQKGFIQIPLIIGIIVSIVAVSTITTGVILHKQGKLTFLVADISEVFKRTEEITITEKVQSEEPPTGQPEINQEEITQHELEQAKLEDWKAKAEVEKAQQEAERLRKEAEEAKRLAKEQKIQEELKKQQEVQRLAAEEAKQAAERTKTEEGSQIKAEQELFFKVVKVVDGDTIKLENGEVVRYIGIDTPETVHPSKPVQCFGKEASDKNKELVEGKLVKLEKDITDRDKYGRLLYYVRVGDLFVNDELVRQGYAYIYTYPPDVKYSEQFVQAQKEARENNRGLWAGCLGQGVVEETPPPPAEPIPPKEGTICSYNAYNCSDFSTHAEAQSVFDYCGGITNDIHRLDADKDSLACESLP